MRCDFFGAYSRAGPKIRHPSQQGPIVIDMKGHSDIAVEALLRHLYGLPYKTGTGIDIIDHISIYTLADSE